MAKKRVSKKSARSGAKASPPDKPSVSVQTAAVRKRASNEKEGETASAAPSTEGEQSELYDQAVEAFHARSFEAALALFERVERGPDTGLQHRGRTHAAMCRQRIATQPPKLESVEDLYNYGVKLINDRELEEAEQRLSAALEMNPEAAHVHYALAVAAALRQDVGETCTKLQRAIELDPAQRLLARGDADLSALASHPDVADLLRGQADDVDG